MTETLRIFSYGILRKKEMLVYFLDHYGIDRVVVTPDIAKGFTCYFDAYSNINFALPADDHFAIPGAVLEFHGKKENLDRLEKAIDRIESFYSKMKTVMSDDKEAIIYVVFNTSGKQKGMRFYQDAIFDKQTIINPKRAVNVSDFSFHPDDHHDHENYFT